MCRYTCGTAYTWQLNERLDVGENVGGTWVGGLTHNFLTLAMIALAKVGVAVSGQSLYMY